jgi:hypothetical protein
VLTPADAGAMAYRMTEATNMISRTVMNRMATALTSVDTHTHS